MRNKQRWVEFYQSSNHPLAQAYRTEMVAKTLEEIKGSGRKEKQADPDSPMAKLHRKVMNKAKRTRQKGGVA